MDRWKDRKEERRRNGWIERKGLMEEGECGIGIV